MDNEKLQLMANQALQNWIFDDETDPSEFIKKGLEYLASPGDWDQEIIDARIARTDDWDGLENWARYLGTPIRKTV